MIIRPARQNVLPSLSTVALVSNLFPVFNSVEFYLVARGEAVFYLVARGEAVFYLVVRGEAVFYLVARGEAVFYLVVRGEAVFHPHELLQVGDVEGRRTQQVAPTDGLQRNHDINITPHSGIVLRNTNKWLSRFNKTAIQNLKLQLVNGQGSHWLIANNSLSMCSPPF